jgi:translation initiation factor IF-1
MTIAYADLSVQQIEKMVYKIHLKREGIGLDMLENTKEPFVRLKKEDNVTVAIVPDKKKEDVRLSLHAIMSGKAYINDKWIKVEDVILGYTLKYVGKRGVVLKNGNTIKTLFLGKPKSDLIILEERE